MNKVILILYMKYKKGGRVMKKKVAILFTFAIMALGSTNIYANTGAAEESKAENVIEVKATEGGASFGYLTSEDEYLTISRNYANLKEENATFNTRQLLLGKVNKGTDVTISIYNEKSGTYEVQPTTTYQIQVSTSMGFEQLIELPEGNNKIRIDYTNTVDKKSDYIVFYIRRETTEDKKAIEKFVVKVGTK